MNNKSESIVPCSVKGSLWRLSIALMLLFFAPALSAQISVNIKNQTIKQALRTIESKSSYKFFYNSQLEDLNKRVSCQVENQTIDATLGQLLSGTSLAYEKKENNQIVIVASGNNRSSASLSGNVKTITGTVIDDKREAIIGANVLVKGSSTNGTITDIDGNFSLSAPDNATLVVSYIGFRSSEVEVNGQTKINVKLAEDTKALSEVIVIGYGTAKRQDFTGSVSSVKMENSPIALQANMNALEALKGNVAGLDIGATNSAGGTPSIEIRGQKSISGSNEPLIVVDGVIFMGSINQINPSDIASYDVLKDATSAAAYGSRSANGVIIITTKKGKIGKPIIDFNVTGGIQTWQSKPTLMNPEQWMQSVLDRNKTTDMSWMKPQNKERMDKGLTTDWLDLVTRTGYVQDYQASISGGSEKMNYYLSTSYSSSQGVVKGDNFERTTVLAKINTDITSWLTVGADGAYTKGLYSGLRANITTATLLGPYGVVYRDEANQLLERYPETQSQVNPLWDLYSGGRDNIDHRNNFRVNAYAHVKCPWIKGLSYRFNYSGNISKDQNGNFNNERYYVKEGDYNDPNRYSPATYQSLLTNANGFIKDSEQASWLIDNILNYKNTFGKHSIDLTAVATRDHNSYSFEYMSGSNFAANGNTTLGLWGLHNATTQKVILDNDPSLNNNDSNKKYPYERANVGYLGRASYSYNDKYFFTGSFRRDGASVFGANQKWGNFAAAGLAWRISNEDFFAPAKNIVNNLKIKASWGKNGNQGLAPYGTLSTVINGSSGGIRYEFGTPDILYGININSLGNPNLGWEKTESWNFGFESAWLNNRIFLDVDAYVSNTKDQLFTRNIPVMTGFKTIQASMGQVRNIGVEANIRSVNIENKDFTWNSGLTFWMNRNTLVHLYGDDLNGDGKEDDDIANNRFIGKSLGAIYGYRQIGIVQTGDTEYMEKNGVTAGTPKYYDFDGDGKITSIDREVLGYSKPNFKINLSNTLSYKNWEMYIMIAGVFGGGPGYYVKENEPAFMTNGSGLFSSNNIYIPYWTESNPTNKYPNATFAGDGRFKGLMSRDFVRLQDVTISYTFTQEWVKKAHINNLKLFFTAKNLATITGWVGGDPEVGVKVRDNTLSALTSFNLGANISF